MPGETLRVLLVEDDPAARFLLEELVEEIRTFPLQLHYAERLSEALELLRQVPIDVLLLDLSLPDAQGVETVTRAHAEAQALAIVVLTSLDDEQTALRAMHAGAQDYLVKGTVDSALLGRSIRYALQRKRAEESARHLAREQMARVSAESSARRSRFIAESSRVLASSHDCEANLSSVARLALPMLADR